MEAFLAYLEGACAKADDEGKRLAAQERKDEANLLKIQRNIYDICKTIYEVTARTTDAEYLQEAYLTKLTELPRNWQAAYEEAREHQDTERIVIEERKLATLAEVKARFLECGGGEDD